jgi:hypothetical protein
MSAFLPDLEPWQRWLGFSIGAALFGWGMVGALWHLWRNRNQAGTIDDWLRYHERSKYSVLTDGDLAAEAALKAARRLARQELTLEDWRDWVDDALLWLSGLFGPPKMIPFAALNELAPKWGIPLPRYGAGQNNPYYLEGALQQAAVKGKLRVEGRKCRTVRHNDPLVPIPAAHFEDYGFGHGILGYGVTDNEASHTGDVRMMTLGQRGKEGVTYYDLHLSKRDARKVIRAFSKDPKIEQS